MLPSMFPAFVIIFACVIVIVLVVSWLWAKERTDELAALARRLGLAFSKDDVFDLPDRYADMEFFSHGHSRTAYNLIHGDVGGRYVILGDYRYTVGSGDDSTTYTYDFCLLYVDKTLGHLCVRPEGFGDKIAAFVGFDDINFEFAEFNDAYHVLADDKRFAYDIIHPKMMEYLLRSEDFHMEMDGGAILVHFGVRLDVEQMEPLLRAALGVADLLPSYL